MEYKELLLKTAVCAIAADGKIDERETKALHKIEKKSPYFSSVDLEQTLTSSLETCMNEIESFIDSTLGSISKADLNVAQELTLLEISIRIIEADEDVVKKEEEFIKRLRDVVEVDDSIISERFGAIEYLGISAPDEEYGIKNNLDPDDEVSKIEE